MARTPDHVSNRKEILQEGVQMRQRREGKENDTEKKKEKGCRMQTTGK